MSSNNRIEWMTLVLLVLIGAFGIWILFLIEPSGVGQTYNNTSLVNTTVNITNSAPLITVISLESPVNLVAYSNKTVYCNGTVFDYDNQSITVNATLFISGQTSPESQDDGNNHYSNSNCSRIGTQNRSMPYSCTFNLRYYADNQSSWICNMTAIDPLGALASNLSNYGAINPLVAIKIPELLDYGDLAVNSISNDVPANITNAGNRNATISVEGYGSTPADGLAFTCDFGSIALNYERYNATNGTTYALMTPLTGTTTQIQGFYVSHRSSENSDSINSTYWKVQIPIGAGGVCTGKILFTASDKGN